MTLTKAMIHFLQEGYQVLKEKDEPYACYYKYNENQSYIHYMLSKGDWYRGNRYVLFEGNRVVATVDEDFLESLLEYNLLKKKDSEKKSVAS